jgi:Sap, sulfolipid-1-addressing protein
LDRIVLSLAVAVVAIALPDCINPSLIAAELLLATDQHPARRTIAFTLAAFSVTFLVGCALALGLGDLILSVVPKPGAKVKYALFVAAGVMLVVGGTFVWIRRKALGRSSPSRDAGRHSRGSPVLLGAGIAGLELLTAFPYFAAIAMIAGASVGSGSKVELLVLYCVVYTLPLIGIAIACAVMGQRAEALLRPVVDWLFARWPVIVGPLAGIIGIGLTAYGIVRLGST